MVIYCTDSNKLPNIISCKQPVPIAGPHTEILLAPTGKIVKPKLRKFHRLSQDTVLLSRPHDLGVHSHQVVVDGVLLLLLGFLREEAVSLAKLYGSGRCLVSGIVPVHPCIFAIGLRGQHSPQRRSLARPSSSASSTSRSRMGFAHSDSVGARAGG